MKKLLVGLAVALSLISVTQANTIKVTSPELFFEFAGGEVPVSFVAAEFPPGQTAVVWLVDSATHTNIMEIVTIDVPVVNGQNDLCITIPFSWSQFGPFHVKVVVTMFNPTTKHITQVSNTGTGVIHISRPINWPKEGIVVVTGTLSFAVWTPPVVPDQYYRLSLTGGTLNQPIVLGRAGPTDIRLGYTVPKIGGIPGKWIDIWGFRIIIEGIVLVTEDGFTFEDPVSYTESEPFGIRIDPRK